MLAPCLGVASLSGVLVAILYTGRRPYTIHYHYSTLYTNLNTLLHCDGLNFIHRHLPRLIHRQHAKRPLERGHLSCLSFQSSWRSCVREDYDDHNDQHDYFDYQNDDFEDHDDLDDLDDMDENLLPTSLTVARVRPPVSVTMQHSASKLQVMMMKITILI